MALGGNVPGFSAIKASALLRTPAFFRTRWAGVALGSAVAAACVSCVPGRWSLSGRWPPTAWIASEREICSPDYGAQLFAGLAIQVVVVIPAVLGIALFVLA